MTYKVVKKYQGAIIGRQAEGKEKEGYSGLAYTFESNSNGCDHITLSGKLIEKLDDYFKPVKEE